MPSSAGGTHGHAQQGINNPRRLSFDDATGTDTATDVQGGTHQHQLLSSGESVYARQHPTLLGAEGGAACPAKFGRDTTGSIDKDLHEDVIVPVIGGNSSSPNVFKAGRAGKQMNRGDHEQGGGSSSSTSKKLNDINTTASSPAHAHAQHHPTPYLSAVNTNSGAVLGSTTAAGHPNYAGTSGGGDGTLIARNNRTTPSWISSASSAQQSAETTTSNGNSLTRVVPSPLPNANSNSSSVR
eukprot:GSA25T00012343001.1